MKEHSKKAVEEFESFFSEPPTLNQKAWGLINEFYNLVLTHMDEHGISKAELAKRLGKSRSAISQIFNKTPNISIKKMVEIADAVGVEIKLSAHGANLEHYKFTFAIEVSSDWESIDEFGEVPAARYSESTSVKCGTSNKMLIQ